MVNKFSGRSFNDMSQYPIFPWIISDYSSQPGDFIEAQRNETMFRDLKKHTGIISSTKEAVCDDSWEDTSEPGMFSIYEP